MTNSLFPPRPKTSRWLRMYKLILQPLEYLEDYGKLYGDFFAVGSEKTPFVYVNEPKAVQAIFSADEKTLETTQTGGFLSELLGDNSLLLLQGERHKQEKKVLAPPFAREKIRRYNQLICDITKQVTANWQCKQHFLVRPVMQEITLMVILQAVFGLHSGDRYLRLKELLTKLLDSFNSPISGFMIFFSSLQRDWGRWSPWGRFLRLKAEVDEILFAEIKARREQAESERGDDILSLLLLAKDEQGHSLGDQELRDELITLLIAGHETTASALTWAMYWIHSQPDVEEKLRWHFDSLGTNPDLNEVVKLSYLNAVCSETLRIYPIVVNTFPRIVQQPWELSGYRFQPGTILAPCIYLIHHREDIYPNSKQFLPERFLEKQYSRSEFLPFGGGSRLCLGMGLALLEMKLTIYTLLKEWKLELSNSKPVKPVRRGLTIAPANNFKMKIIAHE